MPSGKTYTRPADPVLDHPALLRAPGHVIDLDAADELDQARRSARAESPELPDEPPF